eukprot:7290645-Heterocapsa_arctica.AAC.2
MWQSSTNIRMPAVGAALATAAAGRTSTHWRRWHAWPQPATRPFRNRCQSESAPAARTALGAAYCVSATLATRPGKPEAAAAPTAVCSGMSS